MKEKMVEVDYKNRKLKISSQFRSGKDKAIMLIHGLGCSKESFKDIWKSPDFKDFSILSFDLLGFGDSEKPKDFSYKMEDHAEICRLLIKKFGLKNINLVCHSMGGAVGLLLIEKIPMEFLSFINLEGNLIGEDCTFSREAVNYSLKEFKETIFKNFKLKIKHTKDLAPPQSLSNKLFYKWLSKSDPYAFYKTSESLVKWSDSRELLKMFIGLKIKKCYIFGEANKNLPVMDFLDSVPKIQIPDSGHFMMMENSRDFYSKLAELIQ